MQSDRMRDTMLAVALMHCCMPTGIFFKKIVVSLIITVYEVVIDSRAVSTQLAVKPGRLAI